MCNRDVARCQINESPGNEKRRHAPWSLLLQHDGSFGNPGEATDPGPDHHPGSDLLLVRRRLPTRILQCLLRGAHGEDDEIVDLALLLRLHPLVGVEGAVRTVAARNLTGNFGGQVGHVERFDASRAALAVDKPAPSRLHSASKWRHHAEARDDDTSHLWSLLGATVTGELAATAGGARHHPMPAGHAPRGLRLISSWHFFQGTLLHPPPSEWSRRHRRESRSRIPPRRP